MFVLAEQPSVNKRFHSPGHETCKVTGQACVHHVYDRVILWPLNQEQGSAQTELNSAGEHHLLMVTEQGLCNP